MALLQKERGNEAVVLPAAILHDVGWKSIPEELHLTAFGPGEKDKELNRIHEVEGARIARSLLERVRYNPDMVDEIVEVVLWHDSRQEAISVNDAIVKDSDKLWRFCEVGSKVDMERYGAEPPKYMHWLKAQIDPWFCTETGKRMALQELRASASCFGISLDHAQIGA